MKATFTENHDWLRVAVTDADKKKLSLTVSRRGATCSGSVDEATMRKALTAFGQFTKGKGSLGEKMGRLRAHGEQSTTIDQYIGGIVNL